MYSLAIAIEPSLETESNVSFAGHGVLSPGAVTLTAKL
jgi:hypothetical protein